MGEAKRREEAGRKEVMTALKLVTPGGGIHVRWDHQEAATPFGQMAFFAEFLGVTGLWDRWVEGCPLVYSSPNAPGKRDVLGTWLLSILSGHKRYAHVTTIRADGVNPGLFGMSRVISEDALRRALEKIPEGEGVKWLRGEVNRTVMPLLSAAWIMDVDVTIKPLYGQQEGAEKGYNPKKPGRPSHAYHTYWVSGLRLVLDAEVMAGNESHASHAMPGLERLLDELASQGKSPFLVRGDADYGSDPVMTFLESRDQGYLFKLRQTPNVKRYIKGVFWKPGWVEAGKGWEGREGEICLQGWKMERRIILLRRELKGEVLLTQEKQLELAFIEGEIETKRYEYAVLVTSLVDEVLAIAQLYRDRADAENGFDELKNQWGWGGFMTKDLHRCRLSALAVGLVYNWWSLFVRLAHPKGRLEATTSRPLLLAAIGRRIQHGGQQFLALSSTHGYAQRAKEWLTRASLLLKHWKEAAEQLGSVSVWDRVCRHLVEVLTGLNGSSTPNIDQNQPLVPA
jgi:hypothetical protein